MALQDSKTSKESIARQSDYERRLRYKASRLTSLRTAPHTFVQSLRDRESVFSFHVSFDGGN